MSEIDPSASSNDKTYSPDNYDSELKKTESRSLPKGLVETVFISSVAGVSILAGFGRAFSAAKEKDKLSAGNASAQLRFEGTSLALRALGWGSLFAITGVGAISYGIWKLLGVNNLQEFRSAVGKILPKIPQKNVDPNAKTEFNNLTELIQYIIDEDNKNKMSKEISNNNKDPKT